MLVCEGSLCPKKLPDVSGPGLGEARRYTECRPQRKRASTSAVPKKRGRLLDDILQQSPLRSKGGSEDGRSEDSNRPSAEEPPPAPEKVKLLKTVPPCLDLEFSTAQESDDDGGDKEVQIEIDFPVAHPRLAMFPCLTRMPRRRPRGT